MFNKKLKILATIMGLVFMFSLATPPPAHAGWLDSVTNTVQDAYEAAKDTVTGAVDAVQTVVGATIDTAKDIASNVKDVVENTAKTVYETAKTTIKSVVTGVTGVGQKATEAFKDGVGKTGDLAKDLGDAVANELTSAIYDVKDFIADKKTDFKAFQKMINEFKEQGIDIIEMAAAEGEKNIVHPVMAKIAELAEKNDKNFKKIVTGFEEIPKTASKDLGIVQDFFGSLIDQGKNSYMLASELSEFGSPNGAANLATSFNKGGTSWGSFKGNAEGSTSSNGMSGSFDALLGERFKAEGSTQLFGATLSGSTDTVAGAWANGDGTFKFMKDGTLIDAQGSTNVGVGIKSVNEGQINQKLIGNYGSLTSGSLTGLAGAEANAEGNVYYGDKGIEFGGSLGARCGAWADASLSNAVQYKDTDLMGMGISGGAGVGLGIGVEGGFSFRDNKVGFQDIAVTLGPFELGGTFYVNPVGIAEMAIDKGNEAVQLGREIADKGKELLDKVGNKLTFWD